MNNYNDAIRDLQDKLRPHEQEIKKIKTAINLLCELDGKPPMYTGLDSTPEISTQLQGDEYHNIPQATAITEILERRKAANLAPVTVDEIYDDLIAGGFEFTKGKNEAIQKRGIAISMSKNRKFYKLPNEKWGIKKWYNIKDTKKENENESEEKIVEEQAEGAAENEGQKNETDA